MSQDWIEVIELAWDSRGTATIRTRTPSLRSLNPVSECPMEREECWKGESLCQRTLDSGGQQLGLK